RAAFEGIPRLYARDATVLHAVGKSSGGFEGVRLANQGASRLKLLEKHRGRGAHAGALAATWLYMGLRLVAVIPIAAARPGWRSRARTYVFAARCLLRYTAGERAIVLP